MKTHLIYTNEEGRPPKIIRESDELYKNEDLKRIELEEKGSGYKYVHYYREVVTSYGTLEYEYVSTEKAE